MKSALGIFAVCLFGSSSGPSEPQAEERPELWRVIERAIEVGGVDAPASTVLDHFVGVPGARAGVAHRLSHVEEGLMEPWTPPARAAELRDFLAAPTTREGKENFGALLPGIAEWLDIEGLAALGPDTEDPGLGELHAIWKEIADEQREGSELLEALSRYVGTAHAVLAEALDPLDEEARGLLFDHHEDFREGWYRSHMPENRADEGATLLQRTAVDRFTGSVLVGGHLDRARQLAVAQALLRLTTPEMRESLAARLKSLSLDDPLPAGFDGDVRAVAGKTDADRVVLGGPRKTRYEGAAALIIDLGGSDEYARAAVADSPDRLVSVVLDLRGNDVYETDTPGPAFAVGGVALLVDAGGSDEYRSGRAGQGAGTMGFALLADLSGDDVYTMHDYGQGHGLSGVGLLYDLEGDDRYEAYAVAQGGGIGPGFSALVDGDGDDSYLADLHWPDVYGNSGPDCYHGASQGYCTGIRPSLAGGIAALVDLGNGKDRYQSGNFSQGGAYYFSFALMYDGGGSDENFGSRYSQGFGVHQGVAVRWDAGGDDQYTCRSVAHTGMAWDEGVGYFLEDEGDDVYRVGALGCGGAAQTGIAIFVDREGKDDYVTGNQSRGGTGGFEYHDKPSIGVMLDLGGGKDTYAEGRENDAVLTDDKVGVFIDTRAKSLEKLLRDKALRK